MWEFIDENVPPDATLAYTNLILTRPLMGFDYSRKVMYIPTRREVTNYCDLPSGNARVADEEILAFVSHLLTENPDRESWMSRLMASDAKYLLVGKQSVLTDPPEKAFADADPSHFVRVREDDSGTLYQIHR